MNLRLYRTLKTAMEQEYVQSIHDISDGGILCALAECCFGEMLGVHITLPDLSNVTCFAEGTGQFVVSVSAEKVHDFETLFSDIDCLDIGVVSETERFVVGEGIDEKVSDLLSAWTRGL